MAAVKHIDSAGDSRPDNLAIQSALERVTGSAVFKVCPKLAAFLRYVVEATIAGRAARIKAYCIGVDALGRPHDFNPDIDAIVRVEAHRLRNALARYYRTEGAHDPLIIDIPRGCYVPRFQARAAAEAPVRHALGTEVMSELSRLSLGLQALLGLITGHGSAAGADRTARGKQEAAGE